MGIVSDLVGDLTGANKAAKASIKGSKQAAKAQLEATEKNIDFQKWLWGEQKAISEPWRAAGASVLPTLQTMAQQPFTAEMMYQDPGYQFRLSEGMKGIESSAAARGMQLSGATLKGIGRYAQDYASGEFGQAYGRRQQQFSNLFNLANMGQAAAVGQAQQGGVMGGNISQSILGGGQAQAQMYGDIANIKAAQAQSGWNTLMDIGQIGASMYGAGAFSGGGGISATPSGAYGPISINVFHTYCGGR